MSFEGYYQVLCLNGHLRVYDLWAPEVEDGVAYECPKCKAGLGYSHLVNETNGIDPEDTSTYNMEFKVAVPARHQRCDLGHLHEIEEATYKIPVV